MNRHTQSDLAIWNNLRVPDCVQCSLHEGAETVCLLGDGPVPCDAMIVGEAPGGVEDAEGIPFSGKSGIFLRKMLKEIGLDPRQIYFTNTASCRPPANRTPTTKEAKICSSLYLRPQLDKVKPRVILILGNTAASWALGRKSAITKLEGSTFGFNNMTCVPSRHPSSVVRLDGDPEHRKDFLYAQQKFRENLLLFKRTLDPPQDDFIYEKNMRLVRDAPDGCPLYVDIETPGLDPFREGVKINAIGVARIPGRVCSVKMEGENILIVKEMLMKHPIIPQGGTFEGTWLRHHLGILPRIYHDTRLGAFVQNENEDYSLQYQAVKHLGVEHWHDEEQNFEDPDYNKLLPRNARDVRYGLRLYRERDLPFLKRNPKIARLLRYILLPAEEVFTEVICRGVHIDLKEAKKKLKTVEKHEIEINEKVNEIAGRKVNLGSPKQMSRLLYDQLGLECPIRNPPSKNNPQGSKSTSEAALIRLRGVHPVTDLLWDWRGWNKKKTTYLQPWIKRGPILHFNYGFTNTDTGRLNSTAVKNKRGEKKLGATIHQCPRDGFIRNLITARNPDWCIAAADLSQAELRLVAHASGDPVMCRVFNSGGDIHYETARTLQPDGEIVKETRKKAKAVNFGFVYGMMFKKFVAYALEKFDLKLSLKEGKDYRHKFFQKYAGLLPWHRRVESFVTENGWIDSVFGRRRHLPDALPPRTEDCECGGQDEDCFICGGIGQITHGETEEWIRRESVRQAINSPIQSAASDLNLFISALLMSPSLPWDGKINPEKAFMVGSAHDSQVFECLRTYAPELKAAIVNILDNLPMLTQKYFDFKFRVPIGMDLVFYGDCWEGKELK